MRIVILGLSITSSWGNGHATTYRALVRELVRANHDVLFLERDVPWYSSNRDLPRPPYGRTELYASLEDLRDRFAGEIRAADFCVVGSYVPEGVEVGRFALDEAGGSVAFYDIDTPVTLAKLARGDYEYLAPELIPRYDIYLSFTGGSLLDRLEREYGSPRARPLYCSVDTEIYSPDAGVEMRYNLGYLGTYSDDRQPALERLMLDAARAWSGGRFVVAGSQYPESIAWMPNVTRIEHLPPIEHRAFYNEQRYTLNVTRRDMIEAGYSPSVRLFEAAACATPVISDYWSGLESFFDIGTEILISHDAQETLRLLRDTPEDERRRIGEGARKRVLTAHTARHRAAELVGYAAEALDNRRASFTA